MSHCLFFSAVLFVILSLAALASAQNPAPSSNDPWSILHPFWASSTMHNETLFFIAEPDKPASAPLLFKAANILRVQSADFQTQFVEGKDYRLAPDSRSLVLLPGSRIPSKTRAQLYPAPHSPNAIRERADRSSWLLFGEGPFFHNMQVDVTYTHNDSWTGKVPAFQSASLARTIKLLKARKSLTLSVTGDSISEGGNASLLIKAKPGQPAFPQLVATSLETAYHAKVVLKNRAVGGWRSDQGVTDARSVANDKPDLVIIAFGMNDGDPAGYSANVAKIIQTIRASNPDCDFILVASMIGNSEWSGMNVAKFPQFREALAKLCGPGVALADLTTLWQELLKTKRFLDLTGNGVNHPNDFGHRLYAQSILALLVEDYGKK